MNADRKNLIRATVYGGTVFVGGLSAWFAAAQFQEEHAPIRRYDIGVVVTGEGAKQFPDSLNSAEFQAKFRDCIDVNPIRSCLATMANSSKASGGAFNVEIR